MAMRAAEIKAWLEDIGDDELIGLAEDFMGLVVVNHDDPRQWTDWIECGMALEDPNTD